MARGTIFRKKSSRGGVAAAAPGSGDDGDEMTITSGWSRGSMGGNSVSDRIMGRMKKNLSFRSTTNAVTSSSSNGVGVGGSASVDGGGGGGRSSSARNLLSTSSIDGGSGSNTNSSLLLRNNQSKSRSRTSWMTGDPTATSVAGVGAMEEMDSNEAMTLKGQSMGRRRSSPARPRSSRAAAAAARAHNNNIMSNNTRSSIGNKSSDSLEPVEYSLAELKAMDEETLEKVMKDAGVPESDIETHVGHLTVGEDGRKNRLVTLFFNSGHVKLVQKEDTTTTIVSVKEEEERPAGTTALLSSSLGGHSSVRDSASTISVTPGLSSSILSRNNKEPTTTQHRDSILSMNIQDGTASVKSTLSKDKASRSRTKLEKIMELKTENTKMKRENKSLKKTMKKLLGQLSRESERKEELQHLLDEGGMGMLDGSSVRSGILLDASSIKSSRSKQGPTTADNTEKEEDAKNSSGPQQQQQQQQQDAETMATNTTNDESMRSGNSQPPYDVVIHHSDEEESESNKKKQRRKTSINDDTDSSTKVTTTTNKDDSDTKRTAKSTKTLNKNIAYLKRKLKREREAHQSTEFRLKAEIDILNKEVEGLQRELGTSLQSLDKSKKRSRESRETISNLKHDLKHASTRIEELTGEAEARDKLIETFSKILLQRAGLDDGGLKGTAGVIAEGDEDAEGNEEEKLGDGGLMIHRVVDEPLSGTIKLPSLAE